MARGNRTAGEARCNSKLTEEMIVRARLLHEEGISYAVIAKGLGVCKSTVLRAVNGTTWGDTRLHSPRIPCAESLPQVTTTIYVVPRSNVVLLRDKLRQRNRERTRYVAD
jgi:hypothetical protein